MQRNLSAFTDKQLHKKFKVVWRELMERDKPTSQSNKIAFILGGQTGSGKTKSANMIKHEFLNDNCIFISEDEYKKYHPKYEEINKNFHSQVHAYTSEFASQIVKLTTDRAIKENYNIIVEGTLKGTQTPINKLNHFKENGYETGVAVVACPKELSWQSTIDRYQKEVASGGDGRIVPKEAHDYIVSVLPDNAQAMYNQKELYDIFTVYQRDNEGTKLIYNNKIDKEFDKKIIENILHDKTASKEPCLENQTSTDVDSSNSIRRQRR